MAVPAYTARFMSEHAVTTHTITPTDGYIWVVTSIFLFFPGGAELAFAGLVDLSNSATIYNVNEITTVLGQYVLFGGERLVLTDDRSYEWTAAALPDITMCGYALTAP